MVCDDVDRARAQRILAAGAVGASVAHELRNALAAADSALFLARRDIDDRARLVKHLDLLGTEIRRAHDVIDRVLGLARGEPLRCEATPLARLVEAARHELVLPTNVTFTVAITPSDLTARCDSILLERVLSNLFTNAIEALEGRGRGAIATRAVRAPLPWGGGDAVVLEVEDDGPGLSDALRGRLFEPLATTKAHGTGLGLALSKTIIEAHGGSIEAGPGRRCGTVFRFWLPDAPAR